MNSNKPDEAGFILMIVCMVLLIVAIAGFAFIRVQQASGS